MRSETYSAVIPSFNRRETLVRVVGALQRQDSPGLLEEVIVVDDGGSDGAAEAVEERRWELPVRVVRQQRAGPAAARNAGASQVRGDIVLFLCDDIEAEPCLVRLHDERRADVRGPHCVVGRVEWPPSAAVTPFMRFVDANYHFGWSRCAGAEELRFHGFVTANLSVHRELLLRVGGFDPAFPYGFEDTDLGLRLVHETGMRILYAPDALAWHHHTVNVPGYCRRQEALGPSAIAFAAKHPDHPQVTRLERLPTWHTLGGALKRLARNPITRPLWCAAVSLGFRFGATRLGELAGHQLLAYHYYRGIERALRAAGRPGHHT